MKIREEILKEHSKKQTLKVAHFIGADKERFAEIMQLFFSNEPLVSQRIAAVVSACFDRQPSIILPYLKAMIKNLANPALHDAVKRNTVRVLQFVTLPVELQGEAFYHCMHLLMRADEAIAIKVFSMTVLFNICVVEPDLRNELKQVIETQLPYGSAGFKSRAKKVLKRLGKLG